MPSNASFCYEFGDYRFDMDQRTLTRDGAIVSVTPKATEILLMLLKNAGQIVEKEELMQEVWPESFVEEANVSQNIFTLRRALAESRADAKYIETVARRGYRFIAPVKRIASKKIETIQIGNWIDDEPAPEESSPPPTIAVLPFINATGDTRNEYLADGLTNNIINNLSRTSKLRVMSRSAVYRHKDKQLDPQTIGQQLNVDALLLGKIQSGTDGLVFTAELVDVEKGWQLWGDSFDSVQRNILEIQDQIVRQLSLTLRLQLTGDEEKTITARYTDNSEAYKAYLEGRFHWSRYTRTEIEKAIVHFRRAISLDANYALAYAGIIDCYLRLATNYLPPEDDDSLEAADESIEGLETIREELQEDSSKQSEEKVRLRHEWDWKGAERELRRANELKSDYPAAHQWYAAYLMARRLSLEPRYKFRRDEAMFEAVDESGICEGQLPPQIVSLSLTAAEEVQVLSAVAREQIDTGNFDAAELVLKRWWVFGEWPKLDQLSLRSSADLLYTTGVLAGCVASTKQMAGGQKHGEALLNGALGLYEQLGSRFGAAEARIELSACYYRQGLFDLAKDTLDVALAQIPIEHSLLRVLALVRLSVVERHAGRIHNSYALFS
ncbi:MAG: winged helix-turn-helix domain-containing protein, partial [Pyrinomonadaceae bacterium]